MTPNAASRGTVNRYGLSHPYARASHVSVRLPPFDTISFPENLVNLAFGKAAIRQQGHSLNTLFDLFARRLGVGLVLAISDYRLFRLHPDSIPSRLSLFQCEKTASAALHGRRKQKTSVDLPVG